ncbi:MAG: transglutaminaseTgpA domain-containing protein [Streptosporangiaceae bacterium]
MSNRMTLAAALATLAASFSVYPVVAGWHWFWIGIGAITSVAVAGALTRLRRLPVVLCALAELAALLLYVNVQFASTRSVGRLLPTWASLDHLRVLASQGFQDAGRFASPAPAYPAILVLAVTGIGLIAVATDLIAVRLRRPAAAGLPLLVLFCVPLTTSAHQSAAGEMAVFCLGMAGYLTMLAVDGRERLRLWGRLVTVWQREDDATTADRGTPNTKDLAAAGRRIALAAVVIALFVPLLVPGLAEHKLFSGSGPGGGPGDQAVELPNPLVQMNSDLRRSDASEVLSYRTADPDPDYLQVYVLSDLTAQNWTLGPTPGLAVPDGKLPAVPGLAKGTPSSTEHTTVTLARGLTGSAQAASFLPLPYPARRVTVAGDWRADPGTLTMFSGQSLSGLRYTVSSQEVDPADAQLEHDAGPMPASITGHYLSVPRVFRGLTALADRITRGETSSYGQAVALQHWFADSGKFSYSLNVQEPATPQALIQFLTRQRRGYCQQFAFAMAVLARLLGIPSRVAVGYTAGTPVGHDQWVVRTSDAHAWPELYFQGAGWLRFEPTPAGSAGQATANPPSYSLPPVLAPVTGQPGSTVPSSTIPQSGPTKARTGPLGKLGDVPGEVGVGGTTVTRHPAPIWLLPVAALAVLALITPRVVRSARRRQRWRRTADDRGRAEAAWAELLDDLTDYQVPWSRSVSPRALASQLATAQPMAPDRREALTRIARAAERARYAREPADPAGLRADTEQVRQALAARATRRVRWRARLLPPSALVPVRIGLQHALDVFGWMDVAAHRVGAALRRRFGQPGRAQA